MIKSLEEPIEKTLDSMFAGILGAANAEAQETEMFNFLIQNPDWFNEPENFYIRTRYKSDNAMEAALSHFKDNVDWQYKAVFLQYEFYEDHVSKLCDNYEPGGACVDKARSIIKSYLKHIHDGEKVAWKEDAWYLPKFGTQEQWFEFVESLIHLYYGKPEKYLIALKQITTLGNARLTQLIVEQEARRVSKAK